MAKDKVKVIQDWPKSRKVKDVQSFLRFADFYRCFIFNYSDLTVPLTHLTQKDTLWAFTKACQTSFETLKKSFTTTPVLTHCWILGSALIVKTDALDYTLTVRGPPISTPEPNPRQSTCPEVHRTETHT